MIWSGYSCCDCVPGLEHIQPTLHWDSYFKWMDEQISKVNHSHSTSIALQCYLSHSMEWGWFDWAHLLIDCHTRFLSSYPKLTSEIPLLYYTMNYITNIPCFWLKQNTALSRKLPWWNTLINRIEFRTLTFQKDATRETRNYWHPMQLCTFTSFIYLAVQVHNSQDSSSWPQLIANVVVWFQSFFFNFMCV